MVCSVFNGDFQLDAWKMTTSVIAASRNDVILLLIIEYDIYLLVDCISLEIRT